MANAALPPTPTPAPPLDPVAGFLGFLVPGLGQLYQGRWFKGVLFFVSLNLLFYYGVVLGSGRDARGEYVPGSCVYLPDESKLSEVPFVSAGGLFKAVSYRPAFAGQFFIGLSAWPAVYQYFTFNFVANDSGDAMSPGDVEDAIAREIPLRDRYNRPLTPAQLESLKKSGYQLIDPYFGRYMRPVSEVDRNAMEREGSKFLDLGWVYTVIAGVLNILVIYDALAGPAFRDPPAKDEPEPTPPTPAKETTP